MRIHKRKDVPNVKKPEGTSVYYYLFPEYEIHYNEQSSKTTQTWHHHETVWESLYIIEGELLVKWNEEGKVREQVVSEGDLIETERSPHTFINNSEKVAKFLVLKQVLSGVDKKDLLKNDKVVDEVG